MTGGFYVGGREHQVMSLRIFLSWRDRVFLHSSKFGALKRRTLTCYDQNRPCVTEGRLKYLAGRSLRRAKVARTSPSAIGLTASRVEAIRCPNEHSKGTEK